MVECVVDFRLGKQHLLNGGFVCWCNWCIVLQVALALCALVSEIVSHSTFFAHHFSRSGYFESLFCRID